jgi:hypothetical protein
VVNIHPPVSLSLRATVWPSGCSRVSRSFQRGYTGGGYARRGGRRGVPKLVG